MTASKQSSPATSDAKRRVFPAVVLQTNESVRVDSNGAGIYSFPALMPGVYAIKTEMKGFQSVVRSAIELQVQQVARIDFRLRVGQVTEVVEVSGAPLLLATENATIGTVIDNQRIVE